jgi:hypothetical protein
MRNRRILFSFAAAAFLPLTLALSGQTVRTVGPALISAAIPIPSQSLIEPAQLAKLLQSTNGAKPVIIQVGSRVLYEQAHIAGSEYLGPASDPVGRSKLRERLQALPRTTELVLYCGCCPWEHCPNVQPAWEMAKAMGFSKTKLLYIPNNLGTDWVDKGFPTTKGK